MQQPECEPLKSSLVYYRQFESYEKQLQILRLWLRMTA